MNKEVLKYIKTEKQNSKFKIKILKSRPSASLKDVLKSEMEFVKYDFSKLPIESIEECESAIKLFKVSRTKFEDIYENKKYYIDLENVFSFLENNIQNIKVCENKIDDYYINNISSRVLLNKDKTVRSFVYKITLKQKLLLNCLVKCFKNLEDYSSGLSTDEVEYFFDTISLNLFKYYNKSFDILHEENFLLRKEVEKYKPLSNINYKFKDIMKYKNRNFLLLNMRHSGNEKIKPLYIKILNNKHKNVNLHNKFKVILHNDVYYKGVEVIDSNIDIEASTILVAETRREMEDFNNLMPWLKSKILFLKQKYFFRE